MADIEIPVLIVGGSLVGMSAAVLLGHHGVRTLVAEYHRGTAIHPRAAQIHQRSMEIYRTVGIEQIVMARSAEQFDQDGSVNAVDSLSGSEIASYIPNVNQGIRDVSPSVRLYISQSTLEPLLKERALANGADLRFATEMVSFEQDAGGVSAVLRHRDTGATTSVRARYMIAADGAHSRTREKLGIGVRGRGVLSKSATIYFRAAVAPLLEGRKWSVMYVLNDTLQGFMRIEKPYETGFLAINSVGPRASPSMDVQDGLDEARCIELLYAAIGRRDIPARIENVMRWNTEADVAERFRDGNIFIAGDAAHAMPPYGGFGGNTGIADVHNLAWKLALVLKGSAGPALLDSYTQEREPIGAFTTEQGYVRYVTRAAPKLATPDMPKVEPDLNIELGSCYHSSAVIEDGTMDRRIHDNPRETRGRPGTRAPHVAIGDGSTLDYFGRNFVLLAGPQDQRWRAALSSTPVPVDLHTLDAAAAAAHGIGPSGAVLVRPDGFVAWRAHSSGRGDPVAALRQVLAL